MKVGLVANSDTQVGFGHASRMARLAQAFRDSGDQVDLRIQGQCPGFLSGTLSYSASGYPWSGFDVVVADGLVLPPEWVDGALTVQFDDSGQVHTCADVLVNPNLYAEQLYPVGKRRPDCLYLLGPQFHCMPAALFEGIDASVRRGVVIAFGGSDDGSRALAVGRALRQLSDMPITLLIAREADALPDGLAAQAAELELALALNVDSTPLLHRTLLYVGAAGVTSVEALAAGCGVVACAIVDNQRPNVAALTAMGATAFDAVEEQQLAVEAARALGRRVEPAVASMNPRGLEDLVAAIRQRAGGHLGATYTAVSPDEVEGRG